MWALWVASRPVVKLADLRRRLGRVISLGLGTGRNGACVFDAPQL